MLEVGTYLRYPHQSEHLYIIYKSKSTGKTTEVRNDGIRYIAHVILR